jgi:hypothetical protein
MHPEKKGVEKYVNHCSLVEKRLKKMCKYRKVMVVKGTQNSIN